MIEMPYIESSAAHGGNDLSRVAAWLLDCLDRRPPPEGGDLTLYLCYHPDDLDCFASQTRDAELASAMLDAYSQEAEWDGLGFGDLRFDLTAGDAPQRLLLTLRGDRFSSHPVAIEFCWEEYPAEAGRGDLQLMRRWKIPLDAQATISATLEIEKGAVITRHVDRWQREIRGDRQIIYLTEGRTELIAGASVGFDLQAAGLKHPLAIVYDSDRDQWEWSVPGAPGLLEGRLRGAGKIEIAEKEELILLLHLARSSPVCTLARQEETNRLPQFLMEIVGCVLPAPPPDAQGIIPEGLPSQVASRVRSGLWIPGGGLLYLDEATNKPHLFASGERAPGRALVPVARPKPGDAFPPGIKLNRSLNGLWVERDESIPSGYCGELLFDPPIVSRLASGGITGDLPDDFFDQYKDSALGRPPVRLESLDGRRYRLVFNKSALHPVVVLRPGHPEGVRFSPKPETSIDLGSAADFILGSTHYRLKQVTDSIDASAIIEPSITPVGGVQ